MSDLPPELDVDPDLSIASLQALESGFDYFNVAGSGPTFPVAQRAAEAFRSWLNGVGMFSHVGYDAYNAALAETRRDIAAFVGDPAGAGRVALMQSATDGLNTLIAALPEGPLVATSEEHGSALLPLWRRERHGSPLRLVPHRDDASFLEELSRALSGGAAGLVISLVSCRTGKLFPVAEACRIARAAGAFTIVDAAQAAGQVPVDVRALGADAVVLLGHKWLHGPLATGAFWIEEPTWLDPPRLGWRSRTQHEASADVVLNADATRFETGTVDVAAFVGLRQTLLVQRALGETVGERIRALRAALFERIAELPLEPRSRPEDATGIVVVEHRDADVAAIVARMWADDRIVVKHLHDPATPDGIRISFWMLHDEAALDRLGASLSRQLEAAAV